MKVSPILLCEAMDQWYMVERECKFSYFRFTRNLCPGSSPGRRVCRKKREARLRKVALSLLLGAALGLVYRGSNLLCHLLLHPLSNLQAPRRYFDKACSLDAPRSHDECQCVLELCILSRPKLVS